MLSRLFCRTAIRPRTAGRPRIVPGSVPGLKSRKPSREKGYGESVLMSWDFGGVSLFFFETLQYRDKVSRNRLTVLRQTQYTTDI